jgi:hypothetical protein
MRIISPRNGAVYTKVSDLIEPTTGHWDEEMLNTLFYTVNVGRILQIPLNDQGFEDFLAWGFTKHGRYTVCLGYYLQWKNQFGPSAGQLALPGQSIHNPIRKILWRLKIPSKVNILFGELYMEFFL